jgi:hypothetical protein
LVIKEQHLEAVFSSTGWYFIWSLQKQIEKPKLKTTSILRKKLAEFFSLE